MKYYKITYRRAHVGSGNKQYITFYIKAHNMLQAIDNVRKKGGIHRDKLPTTCIEINVQEYNNQLRNHRNAYTACGAK